MLLRDVVQPPCDDNVGHADSNSGEIAMAPSTLPPHRCLLISRVCTHAQMVTIMRGVWRREEGISGETETRHAMPFWPCKKGRKGVR
jgi:hypothetical protein